MKIGIGADHNAFTLKEIIKEYLSKNTKHTIIDFGCHICEEIDYPDVAFQVANEVREGKLDRGILICGTGIGMAITACKVPGIRAALCHDTYSAERAQKSNNAQIITMGAKVIGEELAKKIVDVWLQSEFTGGPSARKVQKIMDKELEYYKAD